MPAASTADKPREVCQRGTGVAEARDGKPERAGQAAAHAGLSERERQRSGIAKQSGRGERGTPPAAAPIRKLLADAEAAASSTHADRLAQEDTDAATARAAGRGTPTGSSVAAAGQPQHSNRNTTSRRSSTSTSRRRSKNTTTAVAEHEACTAEDTDAMTRREREQRSECMRARIDPTSSTQTHAQKETREHAHELKQQKQALDGWLIGVVLFV